MSAVWGTKIRSVGDTENRVARVDVGFRDRERAQEMFYFVEGRRVR